MQPGRLRNRPTVEKFPRLASSIALFARIIGKLNTDAPKSSERNNRVDFAPLAEQIPQIHFYAIFIAFIDFGQDLFLTICLKYLISELYYNSIYENFPSPLAIRSIGARKSDGPEPMMQLILEFSL